MDASGPGGYAEPRRCLGGLAGFSGKPGVRGRGIPRPLHFAALNELY